MPKHQSRYLTQMQFNKLVAERLSQLHEQIKKFKKLEAQGFRFKRVWVKPHVVPKYKTHGHYMRVLVKRAA